MAKEALLNVKIKGLGNAILESQSLSKQLKEVNKALRNTDDSFEAEKLANKAAEIRVELKKTGESQRKLLKEFGAEKYKPVEGSIDDLKLKVKQATAQIDGMKVGVNATQEQYDRLKKSIQDNNAAIEEHRKGLKRQKEEVKHAKGSIDDLEATNKKLTAQLKSMSVGVNATEKEYTQLEAQITKNNQVIADHKRRLRANTKEQEKAKKAASLTKGSYRHLEHQTKLLTERLRQMSVGVNASRKEFTQLQNRIQGNQVKMANFNRKISASNTLVGEYSRGIKGAFTQMAKSISIATIAIQAFQVAARAIGDLVKEFFQLEKGFAKVNTVAQMTSEEMAKFTQEALDTAAVKNYSGEIQELDNAMFDLRSGTDSNAEAMDLYTQSIDAAKAGQVSLTDAANAGLATYGAVKDQVSDAGEVFDGLFAIARAGRTDFQKTASDFPKVAASAGAMGLGFKEAGAGYAVLTRALSSEEAATSLNALLRDLGDPQKQAALKKLGVDVFDPVTGAVRPLVDIVGDLSGKMEGLTDQQRSNSLSSIKFNARSKKAFDVLAASMESYRQINEQIVEGSGGEMQRQLEKSANTIDRVNAMINRIKLAFITFFAAAKEQSGPLLDSFELMMEDLAEIGKAFKMLAKDLGINIDQSSALKLTFEAMAFLFDYMVKPALLGILYPIQEMAKAYNSARKSVKGFVNVFSQGFSGIGSIVSKTFSALTDGVQAIFSLDFAGAKRALSEGMEEASQFGRNIVKAFNQGYQQGVNDEFGGETNRIISSLVDQGFLSADGEKKLREGLQKGFENIEIGKTLANQMRQDLAEALAAGIITDEQFQQVAESIDKGLENTLKPSTKTITTTFFNPPSDADLQDSLNDSKAKAKKIVSEMQSFFKSWEGQLREEGEDLYGLARTQDTDAIEEHGRRIQVALEGVTDGIENQIKRVNIESFAKTFGETLSIVATSTQAIDRLLGQLFKNQVDKADASIDAQKSKIEELEKQAESASGADLERLNNRIEAEKKALVDLEEVREKQSRKAYKREAAFQILMAGIQSAQNVLKAYATGPVVPNFPAALLAGSLGAIQIATIAAGAAKFADGGEIPAKNGGYIRGRSHAQGGVKAFSAGRPIEAEGGELIVNKNIQSRPDFVAAISRMNYMTGGVDFARGRFAKGGVIPAVKFQSGGVIPSPPMGDSGKKSITVLEKAITETNNLARIAIGGIKAVNKRIDRITVQNVASETRKANGRDAYTVQVGSV